MGSAADRKKNGYPADASASVFCAVADCGGGKYAIKVAVAGGTVAVSGGEETDGCAGGAMVAVRCGAGRHGADCRTGGLGDAAAYGDLLSALYPAGRPGLSAQGGL